LIKLFHISKGLPDLWGFDSRLEIIKFMNCSLGTSGTSNHPLFGKL